MTAAREGMAREGMAQGVAAEELPARELPARGVATDGAAAREGAAAEAEHVRVLVIDDEPVLLQELREGLRLLGFDVVAAPDAKTAFRLADEDRSIAVAVTDVRMPGEGGISLAGRILEGRPEAEALEVIMITGHATLDDAIGAVRTGAMDFLRKPFRLSALRTSVEQGVDRAQARRAAARRANAAAGQAAGGSLATVAPTLFDETVRRPVAMIPGLIEVVLAGEGTESEALRTACLEAIREASVDVLDVLNLLRELAALRETSPPLAVSLDLAVCARQAADLLAARFRPSEATVTVVPSARVLGLMPSGMVPLMVARMVAALCSAARDGVAVQLSAFGTRDAVGLVATVEGPGVSPAMGEMLPGMRPGMLPGKPPGTVAQPTGAADALARARLVIGLSADLVRAFGGTLALSPAGRTAVVLRLSCPPAPAPPRPGGEGA